MITTGGDGSKANAPINERETTTNEEREKRLAATALFGILSSNT